MTIALGTLMPATVTITPTVPAARDRDRLTALLEPALAPGWRLAATICGPDLAADAVQEACLRTVALESRFRLTPLPDLAGHCRAAVHAAPGSAGGTGGIALPAAVADHAQARRVPGTRGVMTS
ncbi:MAG: hypothetical protein RLZZ127_2537 [Planctomycetota bacterium]|jgi:hypothetical protein